MPKNNLHPDSDLGSQISDLSLPAPTVLAGAGLFLHASSVIVDGGAILFLGHSTAGKSTIVRILGKSCQMVADDAVFACRDGQGLWRVVDGSFRFGRDDLTDFQEQVRRRGKGAAAVPLRGCFRIHKAAATRIEPLAPVELARVLMDAVQEIDLQRKWGRTTKAGAELESTTAETLRQMRRQWFQWVAEIARACPGWNLWFSKDSHETDLQEALSIQVSGQPQKPG